MLTIEERKLVPARLVGRQRRIRNAFLFSAFLYLISTLPQFLAWRVDGTSLRVIFWYVPLIILWSLQVPRVWERIDNPGRSVDNSTDLRVGKASVEQQQHASVDCVVCRQVRVSIFLDSPERGVSYHVRVEYDSSFMANSQAEHYVLG